MRARVDDREAGADVLTQLRTATADAHQRVEEFLDLMDPHLTRGRLAGVLSRLHGFWLAAEAGLDSWADAEPADAGALAWPRRRRADLFGADLRGLGGHPDVSPLPDLPPVPGTDEALGRLYVLEGSTLGGVFIDRHLATLPELGTRLRAFSPYGPETGAMWHAYRRATRERVAGGGNTGRIVASARATFGALADWCGSPVPQPVPPPVRA